MAGLLGESFDDPRSAAVMALAGGLLQGNVGAGLMGANAAYGNSKNDALKRQLVEAQMLETQAQMRERQIKAQRDEAAMQQAARMQAGIPGLFGQGGAPGGAGGAPGGGGFDVQAAIRLGMDPKMIAEYAGLSNIGRQKVARTVKGMGPDGREFEYQVDEFGQKVGDGMAQYRAPLSVNQGDRSTFVDPYNLKPVAQYGINQSMDSRASQATAMRGQNMTDARARMTAEQGSIPSGYRRAMTGGLEFIPGGPADPAAARRAAPTEDERKAAGWLSQATLAFQNMEKAIAIDPSASKPGMIESGALPEALKNMSRSETRQQFNHGASSLSEAVLRAATGAGVNRDEAMQKVAELTPQWGDKPAVIAQKRAGAEMYLKALAVRSGRANSGAETPTTPNADNDPLGLRK